METKIAQSGQQPIKTWVDYAILGVPGATTSITGGKVIEYNYQDLTLYRFVPEPYNHNQDAFYKSFDGADLSQQIAIRKLV